MDATAPISCSLEVWFSEIHSGHPLFRALRNGLLWHCTSPKEFREILASGEIIPNDGRLNTWGKPYACQELGGVSLFDFTSEPEQEVLDQAINWQGFLGRAHPMTVVIGLDRQRLSGCLIPYPRNKEGTTGNVIPCVEVCHCGRINISAIVSHLLVCAIDYQRFYQHRLLDEAILRAVESEFARYEQAMAERRARGNEALRRFNEQLLRNRRTKNN